MPDASFFREKESRMRDEKVGRGVEEAFARYEPDCLQSGSARSPCHWQRSSTVVSRARALTPSSRRPVEFVRAFRPVQARQAPLTPS